MELEAIQSGKYDGIADCNSAMLKQGEQELTSGNRIHVWLLTIGLISLSPVSGRSEINRTLSPVPQTERAGLSSPQGQSESPELLQIPTHGILFSGTRDKNTDIFFIHPDGSGFQRLTDHWEDDEMPVWSPDGEWIAFKSRRHGNWDIFKMRPDGSHQTRLTDHSAQDESPSWSKDGSMIVFSSDRNGESQIFRMMHDGTNVTELTTIGMHSDVVPSVSPVADLVAFTSRSTLFPNWQIFVIPLTGGEANRVSPDGGCRSKWSPDGSQMVYVSTGFISRSDIWIFPVGKKELKRVTQTPEFDYDPVFSPDGKQICFARGRDEKSGWDLYIINTDGTGLTALTREGAGDRFPSWR